MKQLLFIVSLIILTSCATQKNAGDVKSDRQVRKIMDDEFDKYGINLGLRATTGDRNTKYTYGDEEKIREQTRNSVRIIKCSKDITPLDEKEIKHISSYKYWKYRVQNQEKGRSHYRWSDKESLSTNFLIDNIYDKKYTTFQILDVYVVIDKNINDKKFVENIRNVKWKLLSDAPVKVKFSFDFTYNGADYSLDCKYWRDFDEKEYLKSLDKVYPGGIPASFKTSEHRKRVSTDPNGIKQQFPVSYVKVKRK